MSTLLEQAIVDAKALKDAAIKNAEEAVIEKYSGEIKEAVNSLLEQPEEEALGGEFPEEETGEVDAFADKLPLVTRDGEKLCLCPGEEESVKIDFDELADKVSAAEEELGGEIAPSEEEELPLEEEIDLSALISDEDDDEDIDLAELLEDVGVDLKQVAHGHAGAPTEYEYEEAEFIEKLKEISKEKEEELKDLKSILEKRDKRIKEYTNAILSLKEKFDRISTSNAKLLYTNRVLSSTSLNERQKNKIVEALSKAGTVEEAKVIFETLQNAVGEARKRSPKSLREAVERRSSLILTNRSEKKANDDPTRVRWKQLAGLK